MTAYKFETLCAPLRRTLHAKAMQMTRDPDAAADLVQDALVRALERWDTFRVLEGEDPSDRAGAWLHSILTSIFVSACRSRTRRHAAIAANLPEILTQTMAGSDGRVTRASRGDVPRAPEAVCDPAPHQLIGAGLQQALASLEPEARDIVVRADVRGETYREIQDALGIEAGTVKSRLSRARARLAEAMGGGESATARALATVNQRHTSRPRERSRAADAA